MRLGNSRTSCYEQSMRALFPLAIVKPFMTRSSIAGSCGGSMKLYYYPDTDNLYVEFKDGPASIPHAYGRLNLGN